MKTLTTLSFLMLTGCSHYHSKHLDNSGDFQSKYHGSRSVATHSQFAHDQEFIAGDLRSFYLTNNCQSVNNYQIENKAEKKINPQFNHFFNRYPGYSPHDFELAQIHLATPFLQSSDQLSYAMKNELEQLQQKLKTLSLPYQVIIIGHTNSDGNAALNTALSKRRANNTKDYLLANGIPEEVMSTLAMADTAPINNLSPAASHELNRRVEIMIYQPSTQSQTQRSTCHDFID